LAVIDRLRSGARDEAGDVERESHPYPSSYGCRPTRAFGCPSLQTVIVEVFHTETPAREVRAARASAGIVVQADLPRPEQASIRVDGSVG
jgi:hypothetical protein